MGRCSEEDRQCHQHEDYHLEPQVRDGVEISLHRTCLVSRILHSRTDDLLLLQGQVCLFHGVNLLANHLHLVDLLRH